MLLVLAAWLWVTILGVVPVWASADDLRTAIASRWEYRWGDQSTWHPLGELREPSDRQGRQELWQRVKLPAGHWENQSLFLHEVNHVLEVRAGDEVTYRYGTYTPGERLKAIGLRWHMIAIPDRHAGEYLVLHSYSDDVGYIGPFGYVGLGTPEQHLTGMIRSDVDRVAVSVICTFIGILAWVVYFRKRRPGEYLFFSLFAISAGIYVFCRAELRSLLWDAPGFWMRTEILALSVSMGFFALHSREIFHPRFRQVLTATGWICGAFALGEAALDALGWVPIYNSLHILLYELLACATLGLIAALWSVVDGLIEAKLLSLGAIVGALVIVQSSFASLQILPWNRHMGHWALLILVVSQGVILVRRFILTYYEVEGNLKDRDARLSAVIDALPDSYLLSDRSGNLLDRKLAREDAAMLAPGGLKDSLTETLPRELSDVLGRAFDAAEGQSLTLREVQLPAGPREAIFEARVVPAGTGRYLTLLRNITERKNFERMSQEFVAMVSHELRTPLTVIKGTLGLLSATKGVQLPPRLASLVLNALENSNRLGMLVNDLLDSQKIEAGFFDIQRQAFEVSVLLERSLALNRPFAERRGVDLVLAGSIPIVTLEADLDRMIQALTNLISNAVKFSLPCGTVTVRGEVRGLAFRFSVIDQGPGVPVEFQNRLFEKFTQADSSDTRAQQGTGLGLSITKAIVELHGGRVGFETVVGQGSTFFCDLPLPSRLGTEPSGTTADQAPRS